MASDSKSTQNSKKRFYGYLCGILSGVAYGTNPLFALPLLNDYQMPVESVLFYRYVSATICMLIWVIVRHKYTKPSFKQSWLMVVLGIFFAMSSIMLFTSYRYIPSGIATTIIYLEPVLVALIMVALKKYPTWQKWLAIVVSFGKLSMAGISVCVFVGTFVCVLSRDCKLQPKTRAHFRIISRSCHTGRRNDDVPDILHA